MREHVYLCGLSKRQQASCDRFTSLSLEKRTGNLVLKLEQLRHRFTGNETARLTDFIEIASYVFAADRNVSRGSKLDHGVGAEWRRTFRMVIAVRDLEFWRRADVRETLSETLHFLSEDDWSFEFVENLNPIGMQQYLDIIPQDVEEGGGASIILFSGGIDSLAGAVHELLLTNRRVVLVSHRNLPGVGKRQKLLAENLAVAHPKRVTHVSVDNHLTKQIADNEDTQRTRSFFFTAIATVAAHIEKADRIRFYENGVMSINLPLATQVVGARASRSTHPRSLEHLNDLIRLVTDTAHVIDNPFIWKTKAEVVSELAATSHATLITTSVSCTHARTVNRQSRPHCGKCIQCLHRRISTLIGGAEEIDEPQGYRTDFLTGPRENGPHRVMAVETVELALTCSSISRLDFMGSFARPLSWVLQAVEISDREATALQVIDLHRRYGAAVRDLLIEVGKPYLAGIIDKTLSPDSLLALLLKSRLSEFQGSRPEFRVEKLAETESESIGSKPPRQQVCIALDEQRGRVIVRDLAEISRSHFFEIAKLLVGMALEDRSKPGLSENNRAMFAREIADVLGLPDEETVRTAISRARRDLQVAHEKLGYFDPPSIIERTRRGYRLSAEVHVVTIEEL